ncbi:hypothetical protein AYR66_10955 [Noviherbaspirillum denitrificans]|uniref:Uncharacterized protein n=1 Tax=Noviherbaspirillum denitrificans TaxID=1968433 RepID=A0A254TBD5_9BURK|nr:hypothetical protein AYR66_10955 [Noviherbaspirillum denitrificans]
MRFTRILISLGDDHSVLEDEQAGHPLVVQKIVERICLAFVLIREQRCAFERRQWTHVAPCLYFAPVKQLFHVRERAYFVVIGGRVTLTVRWAWIVVCLAEDLFVRRCENATCGKGRRCEQRQDPRGSRQHAAERSGCVPKRGTMEIRSQDGHAKSVFSVG